MNGRITKRIRRKAQSLTVGQSASARVAMYKKLKKDYMFDKSNPSHELVKANPVFDSPHTFNQRS